MDVRKNICPKGYGTRKLRGASPVNGSKSRYFFFHYSIAYAFRNTHVKFQAGIRKIVEVMNFFVTSCSTSGFWCADFKRVFLETMFRFPTFSPLVYFLVQNETGYCSPIFYLQYHASFWTEKQTGGQKVRKPISYHRNLNVDMTHCLKLDILTHFVIHLFTKSKPKIDKNLLIQKWHTSHWNVLKVWNSILLTPERPQGDR